MLPPTFYSLELVCAFNSVFHSYLLHSLCVEGACAVITGGKKGCFRQEPVETQNAIGVRNKPNVSEIGQMHSVVSTGS